VQPALEHGAALGLDPADGLEELGEVIQGPHARPQGAGRRVDIPEVALVLDLHPLAGDALAQDQPADAQGAQAIGLGQAADRDGVRRDVEDVDALGRGSELHVDLAAD